jgi:hypothetical protein
MIVTPRKITHLFFSIVLLAIMLAGTAPPNLQAKQVVSRKRFDQKDIEKMLTGTWLIDTVELSNALMPPKDFLANGMRFKLKIEGPTRLALEEKRTDELGATFSVLPPIPEVMCATEMGKNSGIGSFLCGLDGKVIGQGRDAIDFEAFLNFERWSKPAELKDIANEFFLEQGGKLGAHFVLLSLRNKSSNWRLFVKDKDTLVSEMVYRNSVGKMTGVPVYWRRVPI